jgi:integrase
MPTIKITESVRADRLRRPLIPSVAMDAEVKGFALKVTTQRAFWALFYQPRGINPSTGKRWGGGVRHELGDAMLIGVAEARGLALKAKAVVRAGGDPHRDHMASRASVQAARAVVPQTVAPALDRYDRAMMTRRQASEWTRKQSVRYARLACSFMNANALPLAAIDVRMVRLLVETAPGSDAQRKHIYGGLNRFLKWCRRQGDIETNPCDALDRSDRPRPGAARDYVPPIATLRAIWTAADGEQGCDLLRFLLLMPLRRNEASGLRWSEVGQDRIRIAADRMKARKAHELPLSPPALAILDARKAVATNDFVFPSNDGAPFTNWVRLLARIRKRIGEDKNERASRVSIHDFRRAFASHLAGSFDIDLLDQCLGHTRRGVLGVYQRSARWPERVRALNAWADLILDVVEDRNVCPSRGAAMFDIHALRGPVGQPSDRGSFVGSPRSAPASFMTELAKDRRFSEKP